MMPPLNLPDADLKIKTVDGSPQVFDVVRRKYIKLTPEEWVRQQFIHYLSSLGYPHGLMAVEKSITLNGMTRRCDLVLYDRSARPYMIVECKAPGINIDQKTFDQISRYNLTLKVDYLIITNGMEHYAALMDYAVKGVRFLKDIPDFNSVNEPLK